MRRKLQILLLPLLAGGCVTHRLWTGAPLDAWNEPAAPSNLRLYHDERQDNLLVVYDEYSERHETTRTRAYFLNENQALVAQHVRPHFAAVNSSRSLATMPVFPSAPPKAQESCYAVLGTNGVSFAVFSGGRANGFHQLPIYNDGKGELERIALTPVAATVDLTIVGGAAGCLWLYASGPGLGGSR